MAALAGGPVATELVAAVCAETDGNPFFTREVVHHLQEDGAVQPRLRRAAAAPCSR